METLSRQPDRVVFGVGAEGAVADLLIEMGAERVLMIAAARHAEGAARIAGALGTRSAGVFTTDQSQVPADVAEAAVARARESGADWVIAHGGGSPIGVAKAIALQLTISVGAVPTTYAGSERTNVWGIVRDGRKITGRDDRVRPRLVAYDPALTVGLDRALSVDSLFNALAHSVEALYASDATPEARRAAEDSIELVVGGIRAVSAAPTDLGARETALRGAAFASIALGGASMGLHHKLAHVLGGSFGTPHARTHATLLPHVLAFNAAFAADAIGVMQRALRSDDPPAFLRDLQRSLGLETSLRSLGVQEVQLEGIVDEVMASQYPNPRPIDRAALTAMLRDAMLDRRPSLSTSRTALPALEYQSGYGNALWSEALPDALPRHQNSPRKVAYGLFAEQINGTGFTVRRAENRRTWMYRLRPQILDCPFRPREHGKLIADFSLGVPLPEVLRYRPWPLPDAPTDFLAGITTFAGAGDPSLCKGAAVHLYAANADMARTAFCNVDGDWVVIPQDGRLHVQTELGRLDVAPGELVLLPRGIRFRVALPDGTSRGFIGEVFDGHFALPERGLIGANGLADERHFLAPVADFEDEAEPWCVVVRQGGRLWEVEARHSPFDVVAWHGTYAPFKYAFEHFNSLGSVSFDHPDPSILTVLTSPLDGRGRNAMDLGVFRGRWDVSEHTFRPPFFHRNAAVEFNGVISSPPSSSFHAGAFIYTPYLTPHAISAKAYAATVTATDEAADEPARSPDDSLWIQFESAYPMKVMPWMLDHPGRDRGHLAAFADFRPPARVPPR